MKNKYRFNFIGWIYDHIKYSVISIFKSDIVQYLNRFYTHSTPYINIDMEAELPESSRLNNHSSEMLVQKDMEMFADKC